MTDVKAPKLNKAPFFAGDLLLLLVAGWIVFQSPPPIGTNAVLILALAVFAGAWLSILPFLLEYRAAVKVAEAGALTTVVDQMNDLRTLANQISFATAQWQVVQDQASQTVKAAHEIAERITKEAQAFSAFMLKANDAEKGHLRLEVEKLRRGEGEWLQTVVRLLDHVHALHKAGLRSGQPVLIEQLSHFQAACRDAIRRLGLSPFEPKVDEPFDENAHQLVEGDGKPESGARISQIIATGFTYQGKLVRPALVDIYKPATDPAAQPELPAAPDEGPSLA